MNWELLVIGAYLACLLALGFWGSSRRRQGIADYFLASRTLTLPMFVTTLVPTFYGGALGVGEFVWRYGVTGWLVLALPYYVFSAVYALFLAGKIRLAPGLSIPDHLEAAYGRRLAGLSGLLVFLLALPADELLTVGFLLSYFTGLGLAAAMAMAAVAAWGVIMKGGLRGDVFSNRLEFLLMFCGFILIFPALFARFGGPARLGSFLPASHLKLGATLGFWQILSWWLIAAWTLVDPAFHQMCCAAQNSTVARRGILVSIGFWAVFDLMTVLAGLYARAAFPSLKVPLLAFPRLADSVLPAVLRGLFFAGIISSALASLQGRSLQSSVSLGKDFAGRFFGGRGWDPEKWSRFGLIFTGLCAFGLALWLPSITGLWYAIGSCVVPGLLLPMLGAYIPGLRALPVWAAAALVLSPALSLCWLLLGQAGGAALWGIEPMLPGLVLSAILWSIGCFLRPKEKVQKPEIC